PVQIPGLLLGVVPLAGLIGAFVETPAAIPLALAADIRRLPGRGAAPEASGDQVGGQQRDAASNHDSAGHVSSFCLDCVCHFYNRFPQAFRGRRPAAAGDFVTGYYPGERNGPGQPASGTRIAPASTLPK